MPRAAGQCRCGVGAAEKTQGHASKGTRVRGSRSQPAAHRHTTFHRTQDNLEGQGWALQQTGLGTLDVHAQKNGADPDPPPHTKLTQNGSKAQNNKTQVKTRGKSFTRPEMTAVLLDVALKAQATRKSRTNET